MPDRNRNFMQDSWGTIFSKGVLIILKLALSVVTARMLGTLGRGIFYSSSQIAGLTSSIGMLSVGESLVYFIARGELWRRQVFGTVFILTLGFTGLIWSIIYILVTNIAIVINKGIPSLIVILVFILIPPMLVEYLSISALRGLKEFRIVNILSIVTRTNLLCSVLVGFMFAKIDVYTAFSAYTAGSVINGIIYLCILLSVSRYRVEVGWTKIKDLVRYGAKVHLGSLLNEAEYRLDVFALLGFVGAASVGVYSIGLTLAQLPWYISNSINSVLFPYITSTGLTSDQSEFTAKVMKYTLLASFLLVMGIALFSYPVVKILFGYSFIDAYYVFLVLAPGLLAESVSRNVVAWAKGIGRPIILSVISGITLIVNVVGLAIFIPFFGIYGAALAVAISYTLRSALLLRYFCNSTGLSRTSIFHYEKGELRSAYHALATSLREFTSRHRSSKSLENRC